MIDRRQARVFRFMYTMPRSGDPERVWNASIVAFTIEDAEKHLLSRVKFADIDQREDVGQIDAISDGVTLMIVNNFNEANKAHISENKVSGESKMPQLKREMSKK